MGFALALFVAFAVGGLALSLRPKRNDARRLLAKTPISRIASFPGKGVGRVVGKVVEVVGGPLVAPATGKPCAYFSFEIREARSAGGVANWAAIFSASDSRDFWIEDATGRARVHARTGATWVVVERLHGKSGTFDDPTPQEDEIFRRYGIDPQGFVGFNRALEYHEATVHLGEMVTVLGTGHRELDTSVPGQGYREPGTRLVIAQADATHVVVSDQSELLI